MPRRGFGLALLLLVPVGTTQDAAAGPFFSFPEKALRADEIVELEVAIPPRSARRFWRAQRVPARVVRVVFSANGRRGGDASYEILLPNYTKCEAFAIETGTMRVLEFLNHGATLNGVEYPQGGFTSLNPDYSKISEAVSVVSEWRARAGAQQRWTQEIQRVIQSENPYLKYLGARFLLEKASQKASELTAASHAPSFNVYSPSAPCSGHPTPNAVLPQGA